MSSLRNAVKRITHKERSQPQARSHLGLLEKKSDYRLRARDYHRKQDSLKAMRKKVANRNPDEFYFGMHRSRVDGASGNNTGRHVKTNEARRIEMEEKGIGSDAVRIMKNQDLAYVRMLRQMDCKKIEKMQSSLHYLEGGGDAVEEGDEGGASALKRTVGKRRKHTIFVEGGKEEVRAFDAAEHFGTIPELMDRAFNRPRLKTLEKQAMLKSGKLPLYDVDDDYYNDDEDYASWDGYVEEGRQSYYQKAQLSEKQIFKQQRKQKRLERSIAKSRSRAYSEMELRHERLKKLRNAEAHLVAEKQAGMKGRKRKIAGKEGGDDGGPVVYKWRTKRKK